jgi:hypothetical protein
VAPARSYYVHEGMGKKNKMCTRAHTKRHKRHKDSYSKRSREQAEPTSVENEWDEKLISQIYSRILIEEIKEKKSFP